MGSLLLVAFFAMNSVGAVAAMPDPAGQEHHRSEMSMGVECHSIGDPFDGDLGDAPCQEHSATLDCTSAACCFQNEAGTAKPVAVGGLSQLRHPLDNGSAVLSRLTVPHDRPPRLV